MGFLLLNLYSPSAEELHRNHQPFNSLYGISSFESDIDFLLFSAFLPDLFLSRDVPSIISLLQRHLNRKTSTQKTKTRSGRWRARWDLNPGSPAPEAYASIFSTRRLIPGWATGPLIILRSSFNYFFVNPPSFYLSIS